MDIGGKVGIQFLFLYTCCESQIKLLSLNKTSNPNLGELNVCVLSFILDICDKNDTSKKPNPRVINISLIKVSIRKMKLQFLQHSLCFKCMFTTVN